MESQERIVPAVSRRVGPWDEIVRGDVVGCTGEAWVMAMKQASISIVRGDGDGNGEDGPERWIVWQRGVVDGLGVAFSSWGSRLKVGVLKIGLGWPLRMLL